MIVGIKTIIGMKTIIAMKKFQIWNRDYNDELTNTF